jgi:hypothetical protein
MTKRLKKIYKKNEIFKINALKKTDSYWPANGSIANVI